MRKAVVAAIVLALSSPVMAGTGLVRSHGPKAGAPQAKVDLSASLARLIAVNGANADPAKMFVGSEFCLACHSTYAGWRMTAHANMHKGVPDGTFDMDDVKGIIFDSNENGISDFKEGLDFNAIASPFDPFKPNAPILGYAEGEAFPYRVTIGPMTYRVVMKEGGFFQQRLMTRIPVTDGQGGLSRSIYMLPFAYSPRYHSFALYNADKWYVYSGGQPTNQPRITAPTSAATAAGIGRSWSHKCIGCHTTGYSSKLQASGEWLGNAPAQVLYQADDPGYFDMNNDGIAEFLNIGCESCHGAGGAHILGGGDPSKIINPRNLTLQAQNELCGQCHSRGASKPNDVHDFPYDEVNDKPYEIGDDLEHFLEDKPGLWPDGKTPAQGEQQWQAQKTSLHWGNQPWQKVLCFDCHDPHNGERGMPRRAFVHSGSTFATSFADNTMCLSCHATHGPFENITVAMVQNYQANREQIGAIVSAHSYHPYNPEGTFGVSNCITCHMPKTGKRDWWYDQTSHTMEAIPPAKTLQYAAVGNGMLNSCQVSCHGQRHWNRTPIMGDDVWTKWGEKGDRITATWLQQFFGTGGQWWDTAAAHSAAGRWLLVAPPADEAAALALVHQGRPD